MASAVASDTLAYALEQFEKEAERAAQLAVVAIEVEQVQGPERTFAVTLLRHTRGARAAAAAWRQALRNR